MQYQAPKHEIRKRPRNLIRHYVPHDDARKTSGRKVQARREKKKKELTAHD